MSKITVMMHADLLNYYYFYEDCPPFAFQFPNLNLLCVEHVSPLISDIEVCENLIIYLIITGAQENYDFVHFLNLKIIGIFHK